MRHMNRHGMFIAGLVACMATAAQAAPVSFFSPVTGGQESPPVVTTGHGFTQVDFDIDTHMMSVYVEFADLMAGTTACHIHAATMAPGMGNAMVATQLPSFTGFPLGVTAGIYQMTFDMSLASSYNPAFITAHGGTPASAEAFLFASMNAGTAYLNVHSTAVPSGEIRGFLAVPEPVTMTLLALSGLVALRRRRNA